MQKKISSNPFNGTPEQEAKLQQEKIELENLKVAAEAEKNKVSGLIGQTSGNIAAYAEQIAEKYQNIDLPD